MSIKTSVELQIAERIQLSEIVRSHLGDDWDFELIEGPKSVYGYPDFERKRIVLCTLFLKRGFDLARKLVLSMVATQVALRRSGKATKTSVAGAFDFMGVPKSDRLKVSIR